MITYRERFMNNMKKPPLPWWERAGVRGDSTDIITTFTLPFIPSQQGRGTVSLRCKVLGNAISIIKAATFGIILIALIVLNMSCSNDPVGSTGTSASGYTMAIRANPDQLRANGTDTALIVIEVWDKNGNYVNNANVTFSVSLGTLSSSTATTSNGVAVVTYTSSTYEGTGIVAAAVENIISKAEIVQFYTTR